MTGLKSFVLLLAALATLSANPAFAARGVAVTINNKTSTPLWIGYWAGPGDHQPLDSYAIKTEVAANASKRITGKVDALSRWDIVGEVGVSIANNRVKQDDGKNGWKVCSDPNWLTGDGGGMKFSVDQSATFSKPSVSGSAARKDDSDEEKEFVITIESIGK